MTPPKQRLWAIVGKKDVLIFLKTRRGYIPEMYKDRATALRVVRDCEMKFWRVARVEVRVIKKKV